MSSLLDAILGNFNSGSGGASGLAAGLALDPGRAKTVMASLAGGNRAEDSAINQAFKLDQLGIAV